MPELERWVLHRLSELLDGRLRAALRSLRLDRGVSRPACLLLGPICRRSTSTSARTCCTATAPDSLRRQAARTVLDHLHRCLCHLAGAGAVLHGGGGLAGPVPVRGRQRAPESLPRHPARPTWHDPALDARWDRRSATPAAASPRADRGGAADQADRFASLQAAIDTAAVAALKPYWMPMPGPRSRSSPPASRTRRTPSERSPRRPATNAPAAGACCRKSGCSIAHPALCCAAADAVESALWSCQAAAA